MGQDADCIAPSNHTSQQVKSILQRPRERGFLKLAEEIYIVLRSNQPFCRRHLPPPRAAGRLKGHTDPVQKVAEPQPQTDSLRGKGI